MIMPNIRLYQPGDQAVVLDLAADTAFFGEPVEAFLEDRILYGDAFARYYTEHEAGYAWVADSQDGIIGFLLGCADTMKQSRQWRRNILENVLVNAITGRYRLGRKTASFAWGMLLAEIRGESPKIDLDKYPAHLQIDVREGYRGAGVGRLLIEAYLAQLRDLGITGVHLETTSHNVSACHLYEKVGFVMLDHRPNRYWSRMISEEVENRSYGMKL